MATHILIVDDNAVNLKLASNVMECEGFTVVCAQDAEQGLDLVRQQPPDLILMDIGLPGMDGLTFTQLLKADPATRHIRIIALTAFAMKGDEERALQAGCDGYLAKPIDTRALGNHVRRVLSDGSDETGSVS
jgi:CheY-like chemotaxis protein